MSAERDDETGYINFDLRMYDSDLGRWMTPDPMNQHFSPYLAMGNDPVGSTDATGGRSSLGASYTLGNPPPYHSSPNYDDGHHTLVGRALSWAANHSEQIGVVIASVAIGIATDGIGDIVIGEEVVAEAGTEEVAADYDLTAVDEDIGGAKGGGSSSIKNVTHYTSEDVSMEDGFAKWLGPQKGGGIGLFSGETPAVARVFASDQYFIALWAVHLAGHF